MQHSRHEARELALQALYQYDARGEADAPQIEQSVLAAPRPDAVKKQAWELARHAWAMRDRADAMATELSPDWPTHRQPVVDRCILRLGFCEIAGGQVPPAVVINEAVELAKAYGSERSPAFINGVLDKIAKRLREAGEVPPGGAVVKPDADPWLSDAMDRSRPLS